MQSGLSESKEQATRCKDVCRLLSWLYSIMSTIDRPDNGDIDPKIMWLHCTMEHSITTKVTLYFGEVNSNYSKYIDYIVLCRLCHFCRWWWQSWGNKMFYGSSWSCGRNSLVASQRHAGRRLDGSGIWMVPAVTIMVRGCVAFSVWDDWLYGLVPRLLKVSPSGYLAPKLQRMWNVQHDLNVLNDRMM